GLSRPRPSVPSGFAQVGALRTLAQSVRSGSVVAIHGAPRAIDAKNRTMTPPTADAGRRSTRRQPRRRRPGGSATGALSSASAVAASGLTGSRPDADTRIQQDRKSVV